jgi:hypothetical protein
MEFNKIEVSGRWYFQEIHHIGQKLNKMVSSLLLFDKKLKHHCTKIAQGPLSTEISNSEGGHMIRVHHFIVYLTVLQAYRTSFFTVVFKVIFQQKCNSGTTSLSWIQF